MRHGLTPAIFETCFSCDKGVWIAVTDYYIPRRKSGYIGFTSIAPPCVLTCVRDNSKSLSQISFKLDTHVFWSGKEPYFKVTLNSQYKRTCGHLKVRNLTFCHLMPSRSQTMWPIWLRFYMGRHDCILLTYTKNQDFMLRLKLSLRPIKIIFRHFFRHFPLYLTLLLKSLASL